MFDVVVDIVLLTFLATTSFAIMRMTNLFAIIMLFGIFSLLSAGLFVVMDAPDVAFTEAAVGAGISTVLMLTTLALVKRSKEPYYDEAPKTHTAWLPLIVVIVTGSALIYGTWDIPNFGSADAPSQTHVARFYLENSLPDTGVPNTVTAVLASYRGFDTLGEVTVIFTAAVAVMLLIGGKRPKSVPKTEGEEAKDEA